MFERLANIRFVRQRRKAQLSEAGRFHPIHSNDNRPALRRSAGLRRRPQLALACRWSFGADGRHLECAWELAASEQPASPWDQCVLSHLSSHLADYASVAAVDQMTARGQIAS